MLFSVAFLFSPFFQMLFRCLITLTIIYIFFRIIYNKIPEIPCVRNKEEIATESSSVTGHHDPVDAGRKLNVHKTFRRRPGRLLNVLYTINLCTVCNGQLMMTGQLINSHCLLDFDVIVRLRTDCILC